MGSFTAMPLLLMVALFVAVLGGEGEVVEAAAATRNMKGGISGELGGGAVGVQECAAAFTNGAECIVVVYQAFRGGDPETAPICCKAMVGISRRCRLLMFPNPNVYPRFRTYCAARGVDPSISVGYASAATARPPVTLSPAAP